MNRDEAIKIIESLYSPDNRYPPTAKIGKSLLDNAKKIMCVSWRDEPDNVLIKFAELSREYKNCLNLSDENLSGYCCRFKRCRFK